jgi:hypothetical protein
MRCALGDSSKALDVFKPFSVECPSGCYLSINSTLVDPFCAICPAGNYSDIFNTKSCPACKAGSYNPGGRPVSSCALCAAGYYSGPGQSACTPCPAGTCNPSSGSPSCALCAAGSYSGSGQSECSLCLPGTWASTESPACTDCPAGTYNPSTGSTSSLSCFTCQEGSFCNIGSSNRPIVRRVFTARKVPPLQPRVLKTRTAPQPNRRPSLSAAPAPPANNPAQDRSSVLRRALPALSFSRPSAATPLKAKSLSCARGACRSFLCCSFRSR